METALPEFLLDVHFADEHTLVPFPSLSAPVTQVRGCHFVHLSHPLASGSPSASPTHSSVCSTHLCALLRDVLPEVASQARSPFVSGLPWAPSHSFSSHPYTNDYRVPSAQSSPLNLRCSHPESPAVTPGTPPLPHKRRQGPPNSLPPSLPTTPSCYSFCVF